MRGLDVPRSRQFQIIAIATSVLASGLLVLVHAAPLQQAKDRAAEDRQISRAITFMLNQQHLTRHPLDDEMSARALDLFIKSLDPSKLYFNQSDIDEFMQSRSDLDDMVKAGDMTFAYKVYNRLLERVDERVALAHDILSKIS
jgi:carboxyl-terminal processing protease